jgi:hypothetical protein
MASAAIGSYKNITGPNQPVDLLEVREVAVHKNYNA